MATRTPPAPHDLGGGLWCIPVPIPANPLGYTLIYVLAGDDGLVLVDAGWDHPDGWDALRDGLTGLGLDLADVSGVVVTHFHPDHAGLAGRVREAADAWIAMHPADAAVVHRMRSADRAERSGWQVDQLRRAGADETELAAFAGGAAMAEPAAQPDRDVADGDLIDLPGRRLRVVWTPGHTPGHICLYLEDARRLFTGDHVLPGITPHIGLYPYDEPEVDPLGDFLVSLGRITGLRVDEALPAHEQRFDEVTPRAKEITEHHEERLEEVGALLSATPRTLWELAVEMRWKRPWDDLRPLMRRLATGEAASHLRLLESRGLARRADGDGMIRFVATGPGTTPPAGVPEERSGPATPATDHGDKNTF